MPIVGPSPAVGAPEQRDREAVTPCDQLKSLLPQTNASILQRMQRTKDADSTLGRWKKTIEETNAFWVTGPSPTAGRTRRLAPSPRRCAIREQRGPHGPKIRLIDDFRAIGINDLLDTADADIPDGLDAMLAMAAFYKNCSTRAELYLRSFEVGPNHSYMPIPLHAPEADFANIALHVPGRRYHVR